MNWNKMAPVVALMLPLGCDIVPAQTQSSFQFALIGDTGYSKVEEQQFERVIAALNANDLAFVIHVGDFQNDPRPHNSNPDRSSVPCIEDSYKRVLSSFERVRHPFVLTPGDNDWTDCHLLRSQSVDPLNALATVRATFYPRERSLGQRTMPVESQSGDPAYAKFVENLRWSIDGVIFATAHIPGSNDNFGRTPEMDAEHKERKAANLAWIKTSFAKAKSENSRGLILMIQANPGFENHWPAGPKGRYFGPFVGRAGAPAIPAGDAFGEYVALLIDEMESYDRPVALLHVATHLFRIDKPLYSKKTGRVFENFTRVETFGSPEIHWVRVTVDPNYSGLFRFQPEIVAANRPAR